MGIVWQGGTGSFDGSQGTAVWRTLVESGMRGPGKRFSPPNLSGSSALPPTEVLGENTIGIAQYSYTGKLGLLPEGHDQGWTATHSKSPSNNAFDFLIGGGIDIPVTEKITIRPMQVEYLLTRFGNDFTKGNNNQSNFRYQAGVQFRF
jgi:opacity protein-like surface antigen